MLRNDNPKLYRRLMLGPRNEYENYVNDVARRMIDRYELATKNMTNPMRRATAEGSGDRAGARGGSRSRSYRSTARSTRTRRVTSCRTSTAAPGNE